MLSCLIFHVRYPRTRQCAMSASTMLFFTQTEFENCQHKNCFILQHPNRNEGFSFSNRNKRIFFLQVETREIEKRNLPSQTSKKSLLACLFFFAETNFNGFYTLKFFTQNKRIWHKRNAMSKNDTKSRRTTFNVLQTLELYYTIFFCCLFNVPGEWVVIRV